MSNPYIEQVNQSELDALILAHIAFLKRDKGGKRLNLPLCRAVEMDFSNKDLREAELPGAILSGGRFVRTDLSGANLFGADLRHTNMRMVNLSKADLRGARLRGSDMEQANLLGTDLREGQLVAHSADGKMTFQIKPSDAKTQLSDVNLSHSNMTNAKLSRSVATSTCSTSTVSTSTVAANARTAAGSRNEPTLWLAATHAGAQGVGSSTLTCTPSGACNRH